LPIGVRSTAGEFAAKPEASPTADARPPRRHRTFGGDHHGWDCVSR
jgi:hypothetical protein